MNRKRKYSEQNKTSASRVTRCSASVQSNSLPSNTRMATQKSSSKAAVHINALPHEIFLKIFLYLSRDDLLSAQFVCTRWQDVTQDDVFWKDFIFHFSGLSLQELTSNLQKMPALKCVEGNAPNSIVDIIINNVFNLHKMKCSFSPPVSTLQMQMISEKYPNLEFIQLDLCSPYFPEYLRIFARSRYLKEVRYVQFCHKHKCQCEKNSTHMLQFLNVRRNFPALENLRFDTAVFNSVLINSVMENLICSIITRRSDQLIALTVESDEGMKLSEAISKCERLKELQMCLFVEKCPVFSFNKVTDLQSLGLDLRVVGYSFSPGSIHTSLNCSSWRNLIEFKFSYKNYKIGPKPQLEVLKIATANMRSLKKLTYCDSSGLTGEDQLKQLGCLSGLEFLHVSGIQNISEVGLKYLSSCLNLEHLHMFAKNSNVKNLDICIAENVQSLMKLIHLKFHIPDLCNLEFKTRADTKRFTEKVLIKCHTCLKCHMRHRTSIL